MPPSTAGTLFPRLAMTFARVKTALRSCGPATRAKVPNVASAEAPKPRPATTVPAAESQTRFCVIPAIDIRRH